MMMLVRPAATASSITYWMMGLSTRHSISLGCALVAGRKRVPRPAAGKTAFLIRGIYEPIVAQASRMAVLCSRPGRIERSLRVLDLKWVVDNRPAVEAMLKERGASWEQLAREQGGADPWDLDVRRRGTIQKVDELRHKQRVVGEEIAKRGRAKEDTSAMKAEMKQVADEIKTLE